MNFEISLLRRDSCVFLEKAIFFNGYLICNGIDIISTYKFVEYTLLLFYHAIRQISNENKNLSKV